MFTKQLYWRGRKKNRHSKLSILNKMVQINIEKATIK